MAQNSPIMEIKGDPRKMYGSIRQYDKMKHADAWWHVIQWKKRNEHIKVIW